MVHRLLIVHVGILLAMCQPVVAQHCAPIYESYLNAISLERSEDGIEFRVQYKVRGGAGQDAYQAYVLAYLERDAARVPAPSPGDYIDKSVAFVLHTQLIKRNEKGVFDLEYQIDGNELAKKMIAHRRLTESDRMENGGWGVYRDRVRIAVFVPWLDDEKYSVIEGLPEDRHCCNYSHAPELLFQTLPYRLTIHFGIVKAWSVEEGTFVIEINGDRGPSSNWPPPAEASGDDEKRPTEKQPPADEKADDGNKQSSVLRPGVGDSALDVHAAAQLAAVLAESFARRT